MADLPASIVTVAFGTAMDQATGVIAGQVEQRAARLPDASDTPLAEHVITTVEVDSQNRFAVGTISFDSSADERTGIPQDLKALLVEYGHRMIGHEPNKEQIAGPNTPGGEVVPHPFLRPAVEDSWEQAVRVFGETLIDGLSGIVETS
jgi:hypothetical protein